jgi:hypothetical protein
MEELCAKTGDIAPNDVRAVTMYGDVIPGSTVRSRSMPLSTELHGEPATCVVQTSGNRKRLSRSEAEQRIEDEVMEVKRREAELW